LWFSSTTKIQKAKEVIKTRLSSHRTELLQFDTAFTGLPLDVFQSPTEDEVRWLISTMPNKSSPVCRLHTNYRYKVVCRRICTLIIAYLAKLSFTESKFSSLYKTASATPLLKKKDLDADVASNNRPISNLHTISKMLERLFTAHIRPHVESCHSFNQYQLAYRWGHSTETTLLIILDDVYPAANYHLLALLLQLDLLLIVFIDGKSSTLFITEFPRFNAFCRSAYSQPLCLFFRPYIVSSEKGVQQGDPIGPCFSVTRCILHYPHCMPALILDIWMMLPWAVQSRQWHQMWQKLSVQGQKSVCPSTCLSVSLLPKKTFRLMSPAAVIPLGEVWRCYIRCNCVSRCSTWHGMGGPV